MKALINTYNILSFLSVTLYLNKRFSALFSFQPNTVVFLQVQFHYIHLLNQSVLICFLMSSARTEALIYMKKKNLSNMALPKCSCIDLCDCQSHLNGAHNANEIKIIDLNPKDLLTSLRKAGVSSLQISLPFLTISKSIGPRRTGYKNATGPSITSNSCCFLLHLRKELIQRQVLMKNLQKGTI